MNQETKQKNKVLIIEDETFLSKALAIKFKDDGFEVETASNGTEGLKKVQKNPPDIIILDLVMPEKNGFFFMEDINKKKKYSEIPIIILSNLEHNSDIERGLELGAALHLVKSNVKLKQVVSEARKILENT